MTDDRTLDRETLARVLRAVDPEWNLREATPADRGHAAVYHVAVGTPRGPRECVVKAAPGDGGVATEARLLGVVADHTDVPVPAVVGAVDDRDGLPTPVLVMESVSGTAMRFEETRRVPDPVLRRVARRTGEYLADLHALDAVDSFGRVGHDGAERLDGGRPSGDPDRLTVVDGHDSWSGYLRATVARELDDLATTRFADLTPRLRSWFDGRVAALPDPAAPVLGRIDHGVHNLVLDPDTGDVASVLDWGLAVAVAPGYDLQCVEYVLSGAVLSAMPGVPDRRESVREALLAGYRSEGAAGTTAAGHAVYELLAVVRAMNHLDAGVARVPAGSEADVAAGLRAEAESTLAGDGA